MIVKSTTATLSALGISAKNNKGWKRKLIGWQVTDEQWQEAVAGREQLCHGKRKSYAPKTVESELAEITSAQYVTLLKGGAKPGELKGMSKGTASRLIWHMKTLKTGDPISDYIP